MHRFIHFIHRNGRVMGGFGKPFFDNPVLRFQVQDFMLGAGNTIF